jgi:hypothetical protein
MATYDYSTTLVSKQSPSHSLYPISTVTSTFVRDREQVRFLSHGVVFQARCVDGLYSLKNVNRNKYTGGMVDAEFDDLIAVLREVRHG